MATLIADLDFASDYARIRDLLYYTYNAPGSVDWDFGASGLSVTFADKTIPRQYFIEQNHFPFPRRHFLAVFQDEAEWNVMHIFWPIKTHFLQR